MEHKKRKEERKKRKEERKKRKVIERCRFLPVPYEPFVFLVFVLFVFTIPAVVKAQLFKPATTNSSTNASPRG